MNTIKSHHKVVSKALGLTKEQHHKAHQSLVAVDRYDLFLLLDYIVLLGEKKDYQENCFSKNHIWRTAKRIMKATNYKEQTWLIRKSIFITSK